MDSDFPMKKSQLDGFIAKWNAVQPEATVNQLLSETVDFLERRLNDYGSAQQVKRCVEMVGSPYAIDGQMNVPIQRVDDEGRQKICQILQNVRNALAACYVRARKAEDKNYSSFNDPLLGNVAKLGMA